MNNNTDNLRITMSKVKPHGHGPFLSRSQCIEAAKADPDCQTFGHFDLIKDGHTGLYDYASAGVLLSRDVVQAHYYLNFDKVWRHRI